jgi:serine/threonine-protein kinase
VEGDVIGGKYRIDRAIAEGAMGAVFAAFHLELREPVAIKFLLPESHGRKDLAARFLREAQATLRIKSEHVVRVMDMGTTPNGAPFLVMELLRGQDLFDLFKSKGPLPIADVAEYVVQACDAIAEAHRLGIVHRDLKPSNLFLTERADGAPLVKVLDFGISKAPVAGPDEAITMSADVLGSPLYMSPEQIRDPHDVDGRADIWALGVILFRLATGAYPFKGTTPSGVLASVIASPPPSLRSLRADVPEAFEAVVLRCLDKDVTGRFQRVEHLARALRAWSTTAVDDASLSPAALTPFPPLLTSDMFGAPRGPNEPTHREGPVAAPTSLAPMPESRTLSSVVTAPLPASTFHRVAPVVVASLAVAVVVLGALVRQAVVTSAPTAVARPSAALVMTRAAAIVARMIPVAPAVTASAVVDAAPPPSSAPSIAPPPRPAAKPAVRPNRRVDPLDDRQ